MLQVRHRITASFCMLAAQGAAAHPPDEDWRSSADTLPLGSKPALLPLLLPSRPNPPAGAGPASEPDDDARLLLVLLRSPPSAAAARRAAAAAAALVPSAPCSTLLPLLTSAVLALLLMPSMGVSRSTGPAALLVAAGASKDSDLELGREAELCWVLLEELVMRPSTTCPAG